MKASKNFAAEHGQSHLPNNMKHTTAVLTSYDQPTEDGESTTFVTLTLEQRRETAKYVVKVRMTAMEARAFAEALNRAADGHGHVSVPTI